MKIYVIIFFGVVCLLLSIGLGYYIYNSIPEKEEPTQIALEKIEDECIEEMESLNVQNDVMAANTEERKVSPNAMLVIKKYYKGCEHTTKEYTDVPKELVNLNEQEVLEYYKEWELKGFSNNEIVIYREEEGQCNEHYVLKELNGNIGIYVVDEKGIEKLKEETKISVEYLHETDKEKLIAGIQVIGNEELNAIIEDFE